MTASITRRAFIWTIALTIVVPTPSQARRFRGRALRGTPRYGPNVLTRDQLRDCIRSEERIDSVSSEIDREKTDLRELRRRLEAERVALDSASRMLDRSSQSAINRFNGQVDRYNSSLARYNSGVDALDRKIARYNAGVDAFNARCSDKSYYESDMRSVIRELQ